jgi:inorganic pyrophosphatase
VQHGKQWLKQVRKIKDLDAPLIAVCEIPANSRCKYKLCKATGHLELGRVMAPECSYPTDYGFVPRTRSSDKQELDVLIITSEPLLPLTTVEVRVVGGFTINTSGEPPEHKLLAAATMDPAIGHVKELGDVDAALKTKIEKFFTTYKEVEDVKVTFEGWEERAHALKWLKAALAAAKKKPPE